MRSVIRIARTLASLAIFAVLLPLTVLSIVAEWVDAGLFGVGEMLAHWRWLMIQANDADISADIQAIDGEAA